MTLKEKFNALVPKEFGGMQEPLLTDCEKIADEFSIELAIFVTKNYTYSSVAECWFDSYNLLANPITSEELLEIFKKEKGL